MNRLDYVLASLRRAGENGYSWSVSPDEASALVAEVERLRAEAHRERHAAAHLFGVWGLPVVAEAVERGEHLRLIAAVESGEHRREGGE